MLLPLIAPALTLILGIAVGFLFARANHRPLARFSQSIERLTSEQAQARALARAQADELLHEQQKMRALLASIPLTVIEYSELGECLAVYPTHPSTRDHFVLTPEQQIGRSVFEIYDKKTAANYQSAITQALKQKQTLDFNYSLIINEQKRNFSAFVTPQGSSSVLWVAREITADRTMETVFGEVLRTMKETVIMFNKQQEIIFFNHSAEKLFGYSEDEIRGQTPEVLMPETYRELHRFQMAEFGDDEQPKNRVMGRARGPVHALKKDGSEILLYASISKVGYGAGMIFVAFMRPVGTFQEKFENGATNARANSG
ncbi:MAG: PAS domain S-box protein [Cyanobacteriota bacterium]|nr:PAS domain S-box protein [Cyanobacteriota bacterium]